MQRRWIKSLNTEKYPSKWRGTRRSAVNPIEVSKFTLFIEKKIFKTNFKHPVTHAEKALTDKENALAAFIDNEGAFDNT